MLNPFWAKPQTLRTGADDAILLTTLLTHAQWHLGRDPSRQEALALTQNAQHLVKIANLAASTTGSMETANLGITASTNMSAAFAVNATPVPAARQTSQRTQVKEALEESLRASMYGLLPDPLVLL